MSGPGDAPPDQACPEGASSAVYACDRHLALCSPIADALGGLAWSRPVVWFHDFGLLPLAGGRQLRVGVAPTGGTPATIKALVATLLAPAGGVLASQEFPLAPYVNRERDAGSALQLAEQGGRYRFVRGTARAPLAEPDRRRLHGWCRAIETWAALLCGEGLPEPGAAPASGALAGIAAAAPDPAALADQEPVVISDDIG